MQLPFLSGMPIDISSSLDNVPSTEWVMKRSTAANCNSQRESQFWTTSELANLLDREGQCQADGVAVPVISDRQLDEEHSPHRF